MLQTFLSRDEEITMMEIGNKISRSFWKTYNTWIISDNKDTSFQLLHHLSESLFSTRKIIWTMDKFNIVSVLTYIHTSVLFVDIVLGLVPYRFYSSVTYIDCNIYCCAQLWVRHMLCSIHTKPYNTMPTAMSSSKKIWPHILWSSEFT